MLRLCILVFSLALMLLACQPEERRRPLGYKRLGPLSEYQGQFSRYRKDLWLTIRRDQEGLATMSTLCSRDLNPLILKDNPEQGRTFHCDLCDSHFSFDGIHSSGPAKKNLPYYLLEVHPLKPGAPADHLYVYLGKEVPADWRLKVQE